jgi:hypothetical protein
VHEIATGPKEEGVKPGRERFNRVFLAMPNCVSLRIQVDNVRGLIRALAFMITSDSAVFQTLNPFGGAVDSVAERNVKVGYSPIVLDVAIRGPVEHVFIVLDTVMEPANLLFEAADFTGFLGITLSDGCEEPFSDGLEDVCIEIRVSRQGGCNCTEQHRWFWTLNWSDQERGAVLSG